MYSRNEATQLKKQFWTVFGQYMAPVHSGEGDKISWVNYKTGEKNIFFRLHADTEKATVSLEITHSDAALQKIYYEQFVNLKNIFTETMGEGWNWQLHSVDEYGKTVSKIYTELLDVSIYKQEDWPKLISFFKTNIIALDEFWSTVKYGFGLLR